MANFKVLVNSEGDVVNKVFVGIDTSNLIASVSGTSYTATRDCFVKCLFGNTDGPTLNINSKQLYLGGKNWAQRFTFFAKKGDVISINTGTMEIYGLKY